MKFGFWELRRYSLPFLLPDPIPIATQFENDFTNKNKNGGKNMKEQIKALQEKLQAEVETVAKEIYEQRKAEIENNAEEAKREYLQDAANEILAEVQEKYAIAKRYIAELESMLPAEPTETPNESEGV
jgi:CRISPR/Cas system CSM-associated protein Csm5 (group 7 of RAMP superfamily)